MPLNSGLAPHHKSIVVEDGDDDKATQHDDKIKIAWRYEQMKKFQTTVPSSNAYVSSCIMP